MKLIILRDRFLIVGLGIVRVKSKISDGKDLEKLGFCFVCVGEILK